MCDRSRVKINLEIVSARINPICERSELNWGRGESPLVSPLNRHTIHNCRETRGPLQRHDDDGTPQRPRQCVCLVRFVAGSLGAGSRVNKKYTRQVTQEERRTLHIGKQGDRAPSQIPTEYPVLTGTHNKTMSAIHSATGSYYCVVDSMGSSRQYRVCCAITFTGSTSNTPAINQHHRLSGVPSSLLQPKRQRPISLSIGASGGCRLLGLW